MAEKEYIEREAAKTAFCEWCNACFEDDPCEPSECDLMLILRKLPTADVRPVVLCRDCKNDCHCMIQDFMEDHGVTPDDQNNFFCGYGEREES